MKSKEAVRALGALAQETRLAIYRLLIEHGPQGMTAGKIAAALDILPATLSFHLKELSAAGLLEARTESRGAHAREDFVERDDKNWLTHSLYYREGNRLSYKPVRLKPQTVESFEPKARVY